MGEGAARAAQQPVAADGHPEFARRYYERFFDELDEMTERDGVDVALLADEIVGVIGYSVTTSPPTPATDWVGLPLERGTERNRAIPDIMLTNNVHVSVLSPAAPVVLRKGTEAEITAVLPSHIELNCKDGHGHGPDAWGLKIKVASVVWGTSFQ